MLTWVEIPVQSTPNPYSLVNYTVYHSVNSGGTCGALIHPGGSTGNGTATSFNITGLLPGTTYCVAVSDWNSTGQSLTFLWGNFTTANVPSQLPGPPTGLTNTTTTATSVALIWTNPGGGGLLNVTVYWAIGSSCSVAMNASSVGSAGTTFTVTGLLSLTQYAFAVTAWNSTGESPQSNCFLNTTTVFPPPPPSGGMDIFPLVCLAIIAAVIVYAVNKKKKQREWWG